IFLGQNGLNWNTDNISLPLKRSMSKQILVKKEKFEPSTRSGAHEINIEINSFDLDAYKNEIPKRKETAVGAAASRSETLNPKQYNSTPVTKDWSKFDSRYNQKISKHPLAD